MNKNSENRANSEPRVTSTQHPATSNQQMKFTLGFSPCPNDCFIFDALVNNKIDTEGIEFAAVMEDVETLNEWALEGRLDISKLSFPAFFKSLDDHILLDSGSALGKGVGPLLISNSEKGITSDEVNNATIAIPGINTTANFLLNFAFPGALNKVPMIFSEIEDAILMKKADLGVIIHESRFTYKQKGLHKLMDLGEFWENKMKIPVPLGGIAIKRQVDRLTSLKVEKLIRKSLEYAFSNYPLVTDYVKKHSQAMSEDVMRQHIDLYVNDYSLSLGTDGRKAIEKLFELYLSMRKEPIPAHSSRQVFLS